MVEEKGLKENELTVVGEEKKRRGRMDENRRTSLEDEEQKRVKRSQMLSCIVGNSSSAQALESTRGGAWQAVVFIHVTDS